MNFLENIDKSNGAHRCILQLIRKIQENNPRPEELKSLVEQVRKISKNELDRNMTMLQEYAGENTQKLEQAYAIIDKPRVINSAGTEAEKNGVEEEEGGAEKNGVEEEGGGAEKNGVEDEGEGAEKNGVLVEEEGGGAEKNGVEEEEKTAENGVQEERGVIDCPLVKKVLSSMNAGCTGVGWVAANTPFVLNFVETLKKLMANKSISLVPAYLKMLFNVLDGLLAAYTAHTGAAKDANATRERLFQPHEPTTRNQVEEDKNASRDAGAKKNIYKKIKKEIVKAIGPRGKRTEDVLDKKQHREYFLISTSIRALVNLLEQHSAAVLFFNRIKVRDCCTAVVRNIFNGPELLSLLNTIAGCNLEHEKNAGYC